jgi:hypothetical protein
MLHVFIGEILADMTQVSDVAPGPLVVHVMIAVNQYCLLQCIIHVVVDLKSKHY